MYAFNASDGKISWQFPINGEAFGAAAIDDNSLYFVARDDHFYAITRDKGTLKWKYPLPPVGNETYIFWDIPKSSPTYNDKHVIVGFNNYLFAWEKINGKWKLKFEIK